MSIHRVLITPQFLARGDAVDRFLRASGCETVYWPYDGSRQTSDLIAALRDVDAAIIASDRITAEVMDGAPQLRVLARPGVGYDSIDVDAATERRIAVCNVPGVNQSAVAELTIGLMLLCARRIPQNLADVQQGEWRRLEGRELRGATLGIIGLGAIGKALASLAAAFGMTVIAYDPTPDMAFAADHGISCVPLERLLSESDFVSVHVFLDDRNRGWINRSKLALMKPTAYLINTARGPVIDETDLYEGLQHGTIAGAALDVTETEPLPADSPLRSLDNVYITPHLGGVTTQARERSGIGAARNVVCALQGSIPPEAVNASALAHP